MATCKTSTKIDPVQVVALALKRIKTKEDYYRIAAANTEADINSALATLSSEDQQHIINICGQTPQPDLNEIANELAVCSTLIELQAVKSSHSEEVVKAAWKLIPAEERLRLKGIQYFSVNYRLEFLKC